LGVQGTGEISFPLDLATDFMVWNITKDAITTRMAAVEEATWAPPGTQPAMPPQLSDREPFSKRLGLAELKFSDFIAGGKWDVDDVLRPIYEGQERHWVASSSTRATSDPHVGPRAALA
jgi:hypothetical protein